MKDLVLKTFPLGFQWPAIDPFLFCVHHDDAYPAGEEHMGPPKALLAGRDMGQDFEGKDGWRMYHGDTVPGFPQHPHRGFETVTVARRGFIDHSDSLGAAARFGKGDTQWMTAGSGIVHSEMFPLLEREQPNPAELFQIWVNLPARNKLVDPHFTMLWDKDIPRHVVTGADGKEAEVTVIAGSLGGKTPPSPPPHSWASQDGSDVAIWSIRMDAGATLTLPPAASEDTIRTLYFFAGPSVSIAGQTFIKPTGVVVASEVEMPIHAGDGEVEILVLQGKPIGEPVAQHGPFVMNTRAEIQKAFVDYQRTQFGGWPWKEHAPVHPREEGRFARHADGRIERFPR